MKRKSILVKTFLNLFALMILLVVIIHVSIFFIYKQSYIGRCTKQIETDMEYVQDILEHTDDSDSVLAAYVKSAEVNICFKTGNQTKYYHGTEPYMDIYSPEDTLVDVAGLDGTEAVLFRTREVVLKSGQTASVQLSMNMQHLRESRSVALSLLPYSLLVSFVFSLLFSYFYSRKLISPILKMSETVKQMTELEKQARIEIRNEDELGELADNINGLYGSFLKIIDDYRGKTEEVLHLERERLDFYRGASHELKTPLAKLSVLTENMKYNIGRYKDHDTYLAESLEIIDELSGMISGILDGVKNFHTEEQEVPLLSVRKYLEKAAGDYQLLARARHCSLQEDLRGELELPIPAPDLEKVLSNVLSNAVKYGTEGGTIRIGLTDSGLDIYNDAQPIPEAVMETIWKGEYILEKREDTGSSGLGLYIVKTILERYGIRYSFGPKDQGYVFKIEK